MRNAPTRPENQETEPKIERLYVLTYGTPDTPENRARAKHHEEEYDQLDAMVMALENMHYDLQKLANVDWENLDINDKDNAVNLLDIQDCLIEFFFFEYLLEAGISSQEALLTVGTDTCHEMGNKAWEKFKRVIVREKKLDKAYMKGVIESITGSESFQHYMRIYPSVIRPFIEQRSYHYVRSVQEFDTEWSRAGKQAVERFAQHHEYLLLQDGDALHNRIKSIPRGGVMMWLDHGSDERLLGTDVEQLAKTINQNPPRAILLGACMRESYVAYFSELMPEVLFVYSTGKEVDLKWRGFNSKKNGLNGIFPDGYIAIKGGQEITNEQAIKDEIYSR